MTFKDDTKLVLKGSFKTLILAICAALIINLTDARDPIYSKHWFFHVWFGFSTTFLLLEARYWYKWASNGKDYNKNDVT